MPSIESTLFHLLASLADNKQALGRHYAFWCTGAPELEASVAAAAMTQDELGHARALYPLLTHFEEAKAQPAECVPETRQERANLAALDQPFTHWSELIAASFLVDQMLSVLLEAAGESQFEPLRQRARKMLQEEQFHAIFARSWVLKLAHLGEPMRQQLEQALRRYWDECLCWFGPANDPEMLALMEAGMLDASPDELRASLLNLVKPVLQNAGIDLPAEPASLPWERWQSHLRRFHHP